MTTTKTETTDLIIPAGVEHTRLELVRDNVCLVLTYRGDGYKATAYDPEDAMDYPCMTLYGYLYDEERETWTLVEGGAKVTLIDARTPREELEAALHWMMQRMYYAMRLNAATDLFHELSWIERSWVRDGAYGNDERDMATKELIAAAATTD